MAEELASKKIDLSEVMLAMDVVDTLPVSYTHLRAHETGVEIW